MKKFVVLVLLSLFCFICNGQNEFVKQTRLQKGKFFVYWGWNYGWFSNSDLHFFGKNYDFTLSKVIANDRQSDFSFETYFGLQKFTIPQYNFRLGYFLNDHYNLSIGMDHMKYVMQSDQLVKIDGYIADTETRFDKVYEQEDISLTEDFLKFEHTDGLNYINIEYRRFDEIVSFEKIKINLTEGFGIGVLRPRTNASLLNKERYDEFHLSGYGLNAVVGLNITLFKHFFIQSEFKGGYMNLTDIRTTSSSSDKASQQFFFLQLNGVFGAVFPFRKKK